MTAGSPGALKDEDVRHSPPQDQHFRTSILVEPVPGTGVLTQDGITQIAYHKYTAGQSTSLDGLLNPVWQALTELLPMTMAPNLVTAIGGLHCLAAYLLTWYYNPNLNQQVPSWLLVVNGMATIIYYTLDCMDGKQARRTHSSSPLGQLFDHGVDCLTCSFHLSTFQCWAVLVPAMPFFRMSGSLYFAFFCAQWEEYYTGVLPHATGQVGVTEVIYGLGLVSILHGFVDCDALYSTPLESLLPIASLTRFNDVILKPIILRIPATTELQLRHVIPMVWYVMQALLVVLCLGRVHNELRKTPRRQFVAFAKLVNPALLAAVPMCLPADVLERDCRYISLALGLAYSFVTIKLIVFSMAKQTYAILQFDSVPIFLAVYWILYDDRLTEKGIRLLWQCLSVWYLYRLHSWASSASRQICRRMRIHLFSIVSDTKFEI